MYPFTLFPRDVFDEFDRLQREVQQTFRGGSSIRGIGRGGFPALNVGSTPQSVELYLFAPGMEPSSLDIQLDHNVLTIAGERSSELPAEQAGKITVHTNERFAGHFRKVVSLPDDIDPDAVLATCRDGVLHIHINRRSAAQPRRISVE